MGAQAGLGGVWDVSVGSRVKLLAGQVRNKAVSSLQLVFIALVTARNGISLLGSVKGLMGLAHIKQVCCPQELAFYEGERQRWEGHLKQNWELSSLGTSLAQNTHLNSGYSLAPLGCTRRSVE